MIATYTIVGTSIRNGQRKLRYSNGDPVARGRRMSATGNTEIALYRLPQALTKPQAGRAYDDMFRNKVTPDYASADFNYDTIGRTPRPNTDLVSQAVKFVLENA